MKVKHNQCLNTKVDLSPKPAFLILVSPTSQESTDELPAYAEKTSAGEGVAYEMAIKLFCERKEMWLDLT